MLCTGLLKWGECVKCHNLNYVTSLCPWNRIIHKKTVGVKSVSQVYSWPLPQTDDSNQLTLALDTERRHLYFMNSLTPDGDSVIRRLDVSRIAMQPDDWTANMPSLPKCQGHMIKNELDLVGQWVLLLMYIVAQILQIESVKGHYEIDKLFRLQSLSMGCLKIFLTTYEFLSPRWNIDFSYQLLLRKLSEYDV